ncbi:response regulator [Pseudomaricurvus alcaniphilus]|uniref:CHASE domain-containing protein n=1 Tax=Pseudomaricurvus alcaniphilus TaxID=1166482 RepID=UPI00140CBB5E|nr:CHASE domain-containing protein [Pseudomaricurvus alcaniphilus]NHN37742.1 response regulator [Pseudomaricurvus alcaniphilus]
MPDTNHRTTSRLWRALLAHRLSTALLVLVTSLLITGLAWYISDRSVNKRAGERFQFQVQDVTTAIERRMEEYIMALRAGVGMFNGSDYVSRKDWRDFTSTLELQTYFPGIQGLGYAEMLTPQQLPQHETEIRAEGFPDYRVTPTHRREVYSAIVYLEPFDWRNQRAFGYDMYSEPTRRAAMDRARDSGKPAVSGRVTLVQETDRDVQYGFLMYYPLYRANAPTATVEQRRQALRGFVYSAFRMGDLMQGILGANQGGIDFEIYDGDRAGADSLLYNNVDDAPPRLGASDHRPLFADLHRVNVGGHNWTLYVYTEPNYLSGAEASQPTIVAICGLVVDILLFLVIINLSRSQQRAENLAEDATRELVLSEERHRLLFTNARAVMLLTEPDTGQIHDANAAALSFYGYPLTTLRQMTLASLTSNSPPPSLAAFPSSSQLHAAGAKEGDCQRSYQRLANGEVRLVEMRSGEIEMGRRSLVLAIIIDVTRRYEAEKELSASERRYQEVFELAPVPMWLIDPDSGALLDANKAAIVHYGYSRAQFLQMHLADLSRDRDDKLDWLDHGGTSETFHRTADGRDIRVEITARSLFYGGREVCIAALVDITERSRNAANLNQARLDAEAANRAKSDFVANMSHEIRTPMNAILGFSQLLAEQELPDQARDYSKRILSSSRALLGLLNDILDHAKVEANRLELECKEFDLEETITRSLDLFAIEAHDKGLQLYLDLAPDLPVSLQGDALRLEQVINNLLGNAVKFTERGEILIAVSLAADTDSETSAPPVTTLRFSVKDTGIGVSAAQIPSLFQPFFQSDTSTTREYGGTGLGLTICRRLVEMMGGRIEAQSTLGVGSKFVFSASFAAVAPRTMAATAAEMAAQQRGLPAQVLLLDQQPTSARITTAILQRFGISTTAWRADAAIEPQADQLLLVDSASFTDSSAALKSAFAAAPALQWLLLSDSQEPALDYKDLPLPQAVLVKPVTPARLLAALTTATDTAPAGDSSLANKYHNSLQGYRILVVEDNLTNQLVARALLERLGLEVDIANNGSAALSQLGSQSYDLVLMDIQMPGMDGLEATRRYRATETRDQHLPIIAMTASAMAEDRAACAAAGMDAHLAKPIDHERLLEQLRLWLPAGNQQTIEDSVPASQQGPHQHSSNEPGHSEAADNIAAAELTTTASGQGDNPPLIDFARLQQRIGGDGDLLRVLFTTFAADLEDCQTKLALLRSTPVESWLAELLHTLKGLAANIEAWPLHELVLELQSCSRQNSSPGAEQLDQLASLIRKTRISAERKGAATQAARSL